MLLILSGRLTIVFAYYWSMPTSNFTKLLAPDSVAIIGASDDPLRIGGRPIAYMLAQGFSGRILPVNPSRTHIQGLPAFSCVADLPQAPDVAIVAVAAATVVEVIAQLAARGTAFAIVFSSGFAEVGPEGRKLEQAMLAAARPFGMRVFGPNSLGLVNPRNGFFASFISSVELGMPKSGGVAGGVAIVSQSGAYGGHLLAAATKAGIGISACIMTGNEADVSLGEMVQMLVDDVDTRVIALYSEGIREASTLVQALEAARQAKKPVVIMKVGRSALGSAAAQSHTASMAGNDEVIDAVFKELGVFRARTTEQLLDIVKLATKGIYPVNNTLGVMTVSGGAGVILSDAAEDVGLAMPELPASAQATIHGILPFAAPRNPVDVTAQFLNDFSLVGRFFEVLVKEGGYPSVLGFFTYTGGTPSVAPRLRVELKRVRDQFPDRLFVLVIQASPTQIAEYEADGFCVFEDPTRAVVAIQAMGYFGQAFNRAPVIAPKIEATKTLRFAFNTEQLGKALSEAQAKQLLGDAGIASAPEQVCKTIDEAVSAAHNVGWPVVMKILSPDILHKSEIGGVLLNITNEASVREGFDTLLHRAAKNYPKARIDGVLVAKQLRGGIECILGVHRDPVFGPIAMFGLGGIFVEIMKDVVLHRCPFGEDVALNLIRSIKGAPLLLGARGRPVVDVAALAKMLSNLSIFAAAHSQWSSIDLNPVVALPVDQGGGAFALDAAIVLAEPPPP
jgi:acetate---CoA ligase (ADP-forming)